MLAPTEAQSQLDIQLLLFVETTICTENVTKKTACIESMQASSPYEPDLFNFLAQQVPFSALLFGRRYLEHRLG